jgi:hypothetical protein
MLLRMTFDLGKIQSSHNFSNNSSPKFCVPYIPPVLLLDKNSKFHVDLFLEPRG